MITEKNLPDAFTVTGSTVHERLESLRLQLLHQLLHLDSAYVTSRASNSIT